MANELEPGLDWKRIARQAQEQRDAAFDMARDYRLALESIASKHGFPSDRFRVEALAAARLVMDRYDGPIDTMQRGQAPA